MKKLLVLFLALAVCLSLVACTSDAPVKEVGGEKTETKPTEEKKELVFGLNETAAFSNLKFTATELKESDGEDFFTPGEGNVFVGIHFTIENVSNKEQSVSSLMMFEAYLNDVKCDYSVSAACVFDEGTLDGSIAPGKKLVGWYSLEVPANWTTIELQVQNDILSDNPAKFVFTK